MVSQLGRHCESRSYCQYATRWCRLVFVVEDGSGAEFVDCLHLLALPVFSRDRTDELRHGANNGKAVHRSL